MELLCSKKEQSKKGPMTKGGGGVDALGEEEKGRREKTKVHPSSLENDAQRQRWYLTNRGG